MATTIDELNVSSNGRYPSGDQCRVGTLDPPDGDLGVMHDPGDGIAASRDVAALDGAEERGLAITIRRARAIWRRELLSDPMVVGWLTGIVRDVSDGLLDPGVVLDVGGDHAVAFLADVAPVLARLVRRVNRAAERAGRVRDSTRGICEREHRRARRHMARFAASLPISDTCVLALADLQEQVAHENGGATDAAARVIEGRLAEREAADRFVEANIGLVVVLARPYARMGVPLADLVQDGSVGLIEALERYDPRRGPRFSSYAAPWIRKAIFRGLSRSGRFIRLPAHVSALLGRVTDARRVLCQQLGREPGVEAIASACGSDRVRVLEALDADRRVISLDAPAGPGAMATIGERIADPNSTHNDREDDPERMVVVLEDMLESIPPREARVLRSRFGLDGGGDPKSLAEIGKELGLSRERVRQIEARAIGRLRLTARSQAGGGSRGPGRNRV